GETIRMVSDIWANGSVLIHNKEKDARRYKKILHNNYRRFVVMVLCATIPTAVIGYAARDLVTLASDSLLAPGIGLILTAVFIIADVSENGKKIPKDISFTNSFLVGIAQGNQYITWAVTSQELPLQPV
ncbi:MAG: undecaprenyl-diphosphate phosphatase, partial [Lachnospiraceae bacterium]